MSYTNRRATMKCCDTHIKKLKYFIYAKFVEHRNNFGKECPLVSELMNGTNISAPPKNRKVSLRPPLHQI